uniref:Uncharacterized protein n=2 Tax=Hucho hucho TaxID=62062 RepID=A0A4W5L2X1_9TELE
MKNLSDAKQELIVLVKDSHHSLKSEIDYLWNGLPALIPNHNPPRNPLGLLQLQRNILASNPRVTRFHINWDGCSDKMEDSENVDPSPNSSSSMVPSCLPGKALSVGLMSGNSMDCL